MRLKRVDCGYSSFLPLCPLCAWRGLPRTSRTAAAEIADQHAAAVHNDPAGRDALTKRKQRAQAV